MRLVPGDDRFVTGARAFGKHPNLFVYDPRPLWRALGDRRWDIIDIHEEPCSLAAAEVLALKAIRARRTPFVLYSAQNIDKRYPIPFRWLERLALRRAAGVLGVQRRSRPHPASQGAAGAGAGDPAGR